MDYIRTLCYDLPQSYIPRFLATYVGGSGILHAPFVKILDYYIFSLNIICGGGGGDSTNVSLIIFNYHIIF